MPTQQEQKREYDRLLAGYLRGDFTVDGRTVYGVGAWSRLPPNLPETFVREVFAELAEASPVEKWLVLTLYRGTVESVVYNSLPELHSDDMCVKLTVDVKNNKIVDTKFIDH